MVNRGITDYRWQLDKPQPAPWHRFVGWLQTYINKESKHARQSGGTLRGTLRGELRGTLRGASRNKSRQASRSTPRVSAAHRDLHFNRSAVLCVGRERRPGAAAARLPEDRCHRRDIPRRRSPRPARRQADDGARLCRRARAGTRLPDLRRGQHPRLFQQAHRRAGGAGGQRPHRQRQAGRAPRAHRADRHSAIEGRPLHPELRRPELHRQPAAPRARRRRWTSSAAPPSPSW